jgi:hypothetical protein
MLPLAYTHRTQQLNILAVSAFPEMHSDEEAWGGALGPFCKTQS